MAQLWTDMYTDPTTNNATHIHMLSLPTLAATIIYLRIDTPNPRAPLPILPPIIQPPIDPPTNMHVMIADPLNKTPSKGPTPHIIDIDMHIQSPKTN